MSYIQRCVEFLEYCLLAEKLIKGIKLFVDLGCMKVLALEIATVVAS